MVIDCMMSLVKHQQADISAQRNVPMTKSEESIPKYDVFQGLISKSSVFLLIRFIGARVYTHRAL
jgi:hypothetical protein